ncbi:acyl-CoA dehydrogenase family protein [Streptomyces sp. BB1-1-1]|uniref:acyl-CoA dehydrogenase family protein n=1 Tax=unclassified Streptomyces TaxID=2593676 RepID=UPI0028777385|nr:acyl-CoA dehydrogenase family protein [Streptomyces sp. BB1-1-1]WND32947.1 acyl-CoA dehydrogenase family protein [Streptomyces sp. BB1-1-1]
MIGACELALGYATERQQFGRPLAGLQLVQDLLVKSLGNITSSWVMLLQLARLQDTGVFGDEHSSVAKAHVTSQAPGRPGAAVRGRTPSVPARGAAVQRSRLRRSTGTSRRRVGCARRSAG